MSNLHFSRMPTIKAPRTKMKQTNTHSTSFNFGKIVPIGCYEVYPGDSMNVKVSSLIRMTTPLVPLMDTIDADVHAFFVPLRLVFKHTEEFFGANKDSAGYQKEAFTIPQALIEYGGDQEIFCDSVAAYMGKPVLNSTDFESAVSPKYEVSCLKERAYWLIWSEWYRAGQIQDPFVMLDSDDSGDLSGYGSAIVGHIGDEDILMDHACANICKKFDYFTAATIAPQFGEQVLLPLGESAPVVQNGREYSDFDAIKVQSDSGAVANLTLGTDENGNLIDIATNENVNLFPENSVDPAVSALVADLSKATAASVNDIRYAFQVQKYLERSNYTNGSYWQELIAHFGITSPDSRLQRPEYLGGQHFTINVQQVLSTAGQTLDEYTKLGRPGANSTTGYSDHLFSKAFVEHGFVIIMLSTRQHSHKYCQGVLKEDTRKDIFDYYFPEFANLGDMPIKNKELFIYGDPDNNDKVFGYQESWAELRYKPDRVSGRLIPTIAQTEDYWTLADNFANLPTLSPQFIEENRSNLGRVLVNGDDASTINDFVADFYFENILVREIPLYGVPGLIDHFGGR